MRSTDPTGADLVAQSAPRDLHSTRPDLDIGVIYTYEDEFMDPLIHSLRRSGNDLRLRLILIDNASTGGVERWRSMFSNTLVVRNEERLGYAPNLNLILKAASAEFVLLLNTDTYFEPAEQCLSKLVRFQREHPRCALAACRLYHPNGRYAYPARRFQTAKIITARRAGLAPLFRVALDHYVYGDRSRYESFPCDWVSGCLMLVRREAILQIGGFDCRYGKYFEDVDICYRLARNGWQVMFYGGTYAFHHEQRASKPLWSPDAWLHLRAYGRWLAKRKLPTIGPTSGASTADAYL
jgi:GT2 family glycosyltransferase